MLLFMITRPSSAAISPMEQNYFLEVKILRLVLVFYRCDINGSNVVRVTDISANDVIAGAYWIYLRSYRNLSELL